ncbi:hypothetical protein NC653_007321 [Populus alba x Populus x berolinensis]|uniref:Uncharacterized protein n=1 Tax=Populus alba x Populus x berolinensis TaxID=444605 RepID=A0AAD6WDR7_9ROSI|nr:hypothetical protein NC653_007321 [Populus alba x Populus x berolinensis]
MTSAPLVSLLLQFGDGDPLNHIKGFAHLYASTMWNVLY